MGVSSAASTPPCKASSMFFLVGLFNAYDKEWVIT